MSWPNHFSMDGVNKDGTVVHSCSLCPSDSPCSHQLFTIREGPLVEQPCRVYWGTHGCELERDHNGLCECDCCQCANHPDPDSGCVAKPPYYGPDTNFYGEDVVSRGLRTHQ